MTPMPKNDPISIIRYRKKAAKTITDVVGAHAVGDLLDHFLNVKDSQELRLALLAHFARQTRISHELSAAEPYTSASAAFHGAFLAPGA